MTRDQTINLLGLARSTFKAVLHVLPALLILWFAWTLSTLTGDDYLGTGTYLAGLIGEQIPLAWMPTLTFLLSCGIAFATGTSWGTMTLVLPIVIPMTIRIEQAILSTTQDWELLSPSSSELLLASPILLTTIGSVLAGSIFGDHCSPISDTTILSSKSCGCDTLEHVRTQMPYALVGGAVSILFGTLPVGFGVSPWILLPMGILALIIVVRFVGRPAGR